MNKADANFSNPDHYKVCGQDSMKFLLSIVKANAICCEEAVYLFNTLKYLVRYRRKGGLTDLKKADDYLTRLQEVFTVENPCDALKSGKMKKNEFIAKLEDLKYRAKSNDCGYLCVYKDDEEIAQVTEKFQYSFAADTIGFLSLSAEEREQLFNLVAEYARTPIKERE